MRLGDRSERRCCFESAVGFELIERLQTYPKMRTVLDTLPEKMLELSSERKVVVITKVESGEGHMAEVERRIQAATFTGKGDKETVPLKYKGYATDIAKALTDVLVLVTAEQSSAGQNTRRSKPSEKPKTGSSPAPPNLAVAENKEN